MTTPTTDPVNELESQDQIQQLQNCDRERAVQDYIEYSNWARNGGDNGPTGHGPDCCYSDADSGL